MVQLLQITPEIESQVQQEVDGFLAGFVRPEIVRPHITISVPWNLCVSPPHTSPRDIAIVAMDIALWVFSFDDYKGDDFHAYCDECIMLLESGARPSGRPILSLFADHWNRLAARGCDMSRFVSCRKNMVAASRRRNRIETEKLPVRFDEYLELRRTLIATRVWLSAWEILDGFWLPDHLRDAPSIDRALEALIYGQILENEIYSVKRDVRSGTPNLVLMYSRERGVSVEEALVRLRAAFDENEAVFRSAKAAAESEFADNLRVRKLLEMMEFCLEGSAALYRMKLSRYEVPPGA